MTEHVTRWLEAYYDGELKGRRARCVEAHLQTCADCRAEFESLSSLSALLQQAPEPTNLTPAEVFVAQVGLRLSRKPQQPAWKKALQTGWQWVPAGLLAAWIFVQATFLVSGLLTWILRLIPANGAFASVLSTNTQNISIFEMSSLSGAGFSEVSRFSLDILRDGGPLGWGITLNLGLTFLFGLLFLSWLASWWVQKSTENGHVSKS